MQSTLATIVTLLFAQLLPICVAQLATSKRVTPKYQGEASISDLMAILDGPPEMLPAHDAMNLSGRETFVEMNLGLLRMEYIADAKDESQLLSAMRDQRRPIERRLCLASFLLDLKNESAQHLVEECLAGEHGAEAQKEAVDVLVADDRGADSKWRNTQLLQQIRSHIQRHPGNRMYDSVWDSLCRRVGEIKLKEAVDPLMGILRHTPGDRYAALALGQIGDPRAIPTLLETVEHQGRIQEFHMYALRFLDAPQLPEILVRHLDNYKCIDVLADLDAKKAIEPLQRHLSESTNEYANSKARLALARLTATDQHALATQLMRIVEKAKTSEEQWSAIQHIAPTRQQWTVPGLLKIAKTSGSPLVVSNCICAVGQLGGNEAAVGLFSLLEHDFSELPPPAKGPSGKARNFNGTIIRALQKATGKNFGSDVQAWRNHLKQQ